MSNYTLSTKEERDKIQVLLDYGISPAEVALLTGRSDCFVRKIKNGTYEKRKEYDKQRQRERRAKQRQEVEEAQKQAAEEAKRQETRRRIKEEAEKAGAPRFEDEGIPVDAKILPATPFSYDNLLRRMADSNDYTNALLNGIMNRLEMLCKELGVAK